MAPAHSTLTILCQSLEHLVEVASDVMTNGNHCTVDKGNPRAFAEGVEFHEHHHLDENTGHEFHETIVGDGIRKLPLELSTNAVEVVLLEVSVCAEMIAYQDSHNLTFR